MANSSQASRMRLSAALSLKTLRRQSDGADIESTPGIQLLARRTDVTDAPAIAQLINEDSVNVFGLVNVENLIEKCLISITVTDDTEKVLAYAGFSDCPNYKDQTINHVDWLSWLNDSFKMQDFQISYLNTFFLHYFVADPENDVDCAREAMKVFFNALPDLQHSFLICPAGVALNEALITVFYPLAEKGSNLRWRGFIADRDTHLPLLHVREAKVEDNDDLVPLLNAQTSVLKDTYGDYYVAELIKAQSETMKCLVADVEGIAVGIMSLNADFENDLLTQCFELNSFNELKNPSEHDNYYRKEVPMMDGSDMIVSEINFSRPEISVPSASFIALRPKAAEEETKARKSPSPSITDYVQEIPEQFDDYDAYYLNFNYTLKTKDANLGLFAHSINVSNVTVISGQRHSKNFSTFPFISQVGHHKGSYHGDSSSVCIELYAIDERFASRASDFLLKVFEAFPNKAYCVITVPRLVPEFSLLQRFTRITPLLTRTLPQELYIFGAPGVLDSIMIRQARLEDKEPIQELLTSIGSESKVMIEDLMRSLDHGVDEENTELQAYVASVEGQLVGMSVIKREEDIEYIRGHYDIEHFMVYNQHRREEHAHLLHFVLNPLFNHYSKHFVKEMLRLSGKTCLYYCCYPHYSVAPKPNYNSVSTAIKDMVPVRARRQIEYNVTSLGENTPSERVIKTREPFALLHISRKLLLEPRITINARIVVVGASDTSISFIETLVFCPHIRFNNITLISPNGLPGELKPSVYRDLMLSNSYCYTDLNYAEMCLRTYLNIVYGKMTAINRQEKVVIVNQLKCVPYDYLILCTGTQYLVTCPSRMNPETGEVSTTEVTPPGRRLMEPVPRSVCTVNDYTEAEKLLDHIKNTVASKDRIIVYGDTLDTYCCLNGLLCSGLTSRQLILAMPPRNDKVSCFNNPDIECKMERVLLGLKGLKVLKGVTLAHWNSTNNGVTFEDASGASVYFRYKMLILFNHKGVDYDAFQAINCSALVFDNRLVIDANFRTNDPSIRAAGPLTKYQGVYYCEEWTHHRFNSLEIGCHLAASMMSLFDPSYDPPPPQNNPIKITPTYTCPKVTGGMLPGCFNYLHVHKPKLEIHYHDEMSRSSYGVALTSGSNIKENDEAGYFRLHLNKHKLIETITCMTRQPILVSNLICLYGLHHKLLNNLIGRWYERLIPDLFSFFHEPWAMVLYHDRFRDFREDVRDLVAIKYQQVQNGEQSSTESIEDFLRGVLDKNLMTEERNLVMLREKYREAQLDVTTRKKLASYLQFNYYHLPMYAKPGMV